MGNEIPQWLSVNAKYLYSIMVGGREGRSPRKHILGAILVFCFLLAWRCWFLSQEVNNRYLQVLLDTPQSGAVQLYYDRGDGFNEYDSVVAMPLSGRPSELPSQVFQFQVNPSVIHALRLVDAGGEIVHLSLFNGLGILLQDIDLSSLAPGSSLVPAQKGVATQERLVFEGEGKEQSTIVLAVPLVISKGRGALAPGMASKVLFEGMILGICLLLLSFIGIRLAGAYRISENSLVLKRALFSPATQNQIIFISITALYFWAYRYFATYLSPVYFEKAFFGVLLLLVVRFLYARHSKQSPLVVLLIAMGCYLILLFLSAAGHTLALNGVGPDNYLSINSMLLQGSIFDKAEYLSKIIDSASNSDQTLFLYLFPFVYITAISLFQGTGKEWQKLCVIVALTLPNIIAATVWKSLMISHETFFGDSIVSMRILLIFLFPLTVLVFVILKSWWQKSLAVLIALDLLWLAKVTNGRATLLGILIFLLLLPFIRSWVRREKFGSLGNRFTFVFVFLVGGALLVGFAVPRYHPLLSRVLSRATVNSAHALLTGERDRKSPVYTRIEMMHQAGRLVAEAPLSGWGPAAYQNNSNRMRFQNGEKTGVSHVITNIYLLVLGDYGVLVLLLFLFMQLFPLFMVVCVQRKIASSEERWAVGIVFAVCVIMLLLFNTNPYLSFLEINWIYLVFLAYLFSVGQRYGFRLQLPPHSRRFSLIAFLLLFAYIAGIYRVTYGEFSYGKRYTALVDKISEGYTAGKQVELLRLPGKGGEPEATDRLIATRATPFQPRYTTYIYQLDAETDKIAVDSKGHYYALEVNVSQGRWQDFYMALTVYVKGRGKQTHNFQIAGTKRLILYFDDNRKVNDVRIKARAWWALPYHEDLRKEVRRGPVLMKSQDFDDLGVTISLVQYNKL